MTLLSPFSIVPNLVPTEGGTEIKLTSACGLGSSATKSTAQSEQRVKPGRYSDLHSGQNIRDMRQSTITNERCCFPLQGDADYVVQILIKRGNQTSGPWLSALESPFGDGGVGDGIVYNTLMVINN